MDLKGSAWQSCWVLCSCSLGFGSSQICCREAEAQELSALLAVLGLPAMQREILGLRGAGSSGWGALSLVCSAHPCSLEPSVGMSPRTGDSGWDEVGQCLIWVLCWPHLCGSLLESPVGVEASPLSAGMSLKLPSPPRLSLDPAWIFIAQSPAPPQGQLDHFQFAHKPIKLQLNVIKRP